MKKILIIEDEPAIRANLERLLAMEGYEALSAASGQAGIEGAMTIRPDLILCDLLMPDLDGHEVIARLSEDPHTARIPVIIVSASAGDDDRALGLEVGARAYITKPFRLNEVLETISRCLSTDQ